MATIVILGAVVSAAAFGGSNYLSLLIGKGSDEETKRHVLAEEQLKSTDATWSNKRTANLDWVNEELRRENHAVRTFQNVEESMREYQLAYTQKSIAPLDPEPQLSDFYVPSETQKDREIAFIVVGMGGIDLVSHYIEKAISKSNVS